VFRSSASLFAVTTLVWGSTWLAIKYQLGEVAPEMSIVYRFAIAAVMVAAWARLRGQSLRLSAGAHAAVALQGVLLFSLNYVMVYRAERYATSGLIAVLFSTIVFMNAIGSRLVFATPVTLRTLVAGTMGVTGVALLFVPELTQAAHGDAVGLAIALGIASPLFASAGSLAALRNHAAGIRVLPGTAWGMAYGTLTTALIATAMGVPWALDPRPAYIASLAYLAVLGSVVGFAAYLTLLTRVGATRAAYVNVATPVVAMLLSTLFEGYRWTPLAAFGVVLAVMGNWLALARKSGSEERLARNVRG
jgi:drug/metabolite transporter (DMT)-like permease